MKTQRDVASFVMRMTHDLWRDGNGEPRVQWRGHIQHVQSRAEASFTDFADAFAFIQQHTAQVTMDSVAGEDPMHQDKAMRESQNLWQRFASSYTNMMIESLEQTARQSDKSMQLLLNAWRMPFGSPQTTADPHSPDPAGPNTEVLRAIRELSASVERLSERVERLESTPVAERRPRPAKQKKQTNQPRNTGV